MEVKFWGVRGSLAAPLEPHQVELKIKNAIESFVSSHGSDLSLLPEFLRKNSALAGFGGHTSCVEIRAKEDRLVIDGGSGLRALGDELMTTELGQGKGHINMLMTHFHWDHLVGLPFFAPFYVAGNIIDIYSPDPYAETAFKTVFQKPFFPLPFDHLSAEIRFHILPPREEFTISSFKVAAYRLDHPDPCWGYKVTSQGKTLSYAVDTEAYRQTAQELGEDLPLYQNSDMLIFDAQYTLDELRLKKNWGHSSARIGLQMSIDNKIPKVVFVHHDPGSSDEDIQKSIAEAEKEWANLKTAHPGNSIQWHFVREGEVVKV